MLIYGACEFLFIVSYVSWRKIFLMSNQHMRNASTTSFFIFFSVTLATHFVVQAAPTLECHHLNQEKKLHYQTGNSILTIDQHGEL